MVTTFVNQQEGGVHYVGASDEFGEYVLWQVSAKDPEQIYFEYDDQANGGYDDTIQVDVMRDGTHIVLSSGKMVHYYFSVSPDLNSDFEQFVLGLKEIYRSHPNILQVIR